MWSADPTRRAACPFATTGVALPGAGVLPRAAPVRRSYVRSAELPESDVTMYTTAPAMPGPYTNVEPDGGAVDQTVESSLRRAASRLPADERLTATDPVSAPKAPGPSSPVSASTDAGKLPSSSPRMSY